MNITPVTPKLNWAPGVRESINGGKTIPANAKVVTKTDMQEAVERAKAYATETRFDTFNKEALTGNIQRPVWADGVKEKINGGKSLPAEVKEAVAKERMQEAADKAKEYAQKPRLGEVEIDPKKLKQAKAEAAASEAAEGAKGFIKNAINAVKKHPVITAIVVAVPVVAAALYGYKKVSEDQQVKKA